MLHHNFMTQNLNLISSVSFEKVHISTEEGNRNEKGDTLQSITECVKVKIKSVKQLSLFFHVFSEIVF